MTATNDGHVLLPTSSIPWIPTGPGKAFRPIRFDRHGWTELMRVEPGAEVGPHRHTGAVHGFNISGSRELIEAAVVVGPGDYVHEPVGNIDSWRGAGDEPCVVHIRVEGVVEFFDADGRTTSVASAQTQQAIYLAWCRENGVEADPALAVDIS